MSLQDRKVSRLLHCLSPREQQQFLRSLPSQLIAKTQVLVTLAEGILALEDSPRALWTQMYPDTHPYDDARFRKLCELLVEKLESFLACQELEAQPLMKQNLLIQALGNRNLGAEYPKACRKIHKQLDRQPLRNLSYYRTRLVLSRMVQDHNNKAPAHSFSLPGLDHYATCWEQHHLLETLYYLCMQLVMRYPVPMHEQIMPVDAWIEKLRACQPLQQLPLARAYFQLIDYLQGKTLSLKSCLQALQEVREMVTPVLFQDMLGMLSYRCNTNINRYEDRQLLKEAIEYYTFCFQEGFFLEENYLSPRLYKNIVSLRVRYDTHFHTQRPSLEARQSIQHFLDENKSRLPPDRRESYHAFCQTVLQFNCGAYEDIIKTYNFYLQRFPTFALAIDYRFMYLQSNYEEGVLRYLLSETRKLRKYIRAADLSEEKQAPYIKRLRFFSKLVSLTKRQAGPERDLSVRKFLQTLDEAPTNVQGISWIRQKAQKLL